jgi:hypothetical protein
MLNPNRRQFLQGLGCSLLIGKSAMLQTNHTSCQDENCLICQGKRQKPLVIELLSQPKEIPNDNPR